MVHQQLYFVVLKYEKRTEGVNGSKNTNENGYSHCLRIPFSHSYFPVVLKVLKKIYVGNILIVD